MAGSRWRQPVERACAAILVGVVGALAFGLVIALAVLV